MPKPGKPIPDGFHALTPHLTVRDGAKMIEFYKKAFGAVELSRFPGPSGGIMHALLKIGDSVLMLNDEFPEMKCYSPLSFEGTPVTISLCVTNVDEVFQRAVNAGASAVMPVQDMFWGDRYGQVKDPSGHLWEISTHKEDLTPAEMTQRAEEFFAAAAK